MVETIHFNVTIDTDLMKEKTLSSTAEVENVRKQLFDEIKEWEGVLCVSSARLEEVELWNHNNG